MTQHSDKMDGDVIDVHAEPVSSDLSGEDKINLEEQGSLSRAKEWKTFSEETVHRSGNFNRPIYLHITRQVSMNSEPGCGCGGCGCLALILALLFLMMSCSATMGMG